MNKSQVQQPVILLVKVFKNQNFILHLYSVFYGEASKRPNTYLRKNNIQNIYILASVNILCMHYNLIKLQYQYLAPGADIFCIQRMSHLVFKHMHSFQFETISIKYKMSNLDKD